MEVSIRHLRTQTAVAVAASWPCWRRWAPSATGPAVQDPMALDYYVAGLARPMARDRRQQGVAREARAGSGLHGRNGGFPLPKVTVRRVRRIVLSMRLRIAQEPPWTSSSHCRVDTTASDTARSRSRRTKPHQQVTSRSLLAGVPPHATPSRPIRTRAFAHLPQQPGGRHHERHGGPGPGHLGPLPGKPVMEGKASSSEGQRDQRVDIEIAENDPKELVKRSRAWSAFGGINLEDIKAPSASTSSGAARTHEDPGGSHDSTARHRGLRGSSTDEVRGQGLREGKS